MDENDLFSVYIDDDGSVLLDLDTRVDTWSTTCVEQFQTLACECLIVLTYKERIVTMFPVMCRLVELEKQFCVPVDKDRRMMRLAEDL